jgi:hypothetical protein
MTFASGYRGTSGGAVQSTYQDQMGLAVNGMMAYAAEEGIANIDAIFIGETNGIRAGAGVRFLAATQNQGGYQRPPVQAFLPEGDETADEFAGIVLFDEAMQSNENGVPGWAKNRVARILRPSRSGGRVYVKVKDAIVPGTSTVNWVIAADSVGKYEAGDFCPTALGGGAVGTSVLLTNCKWETEADANGLAILEFHGTIVPVTSTDDPSL